MKGLNEQLAKMKQVINDPKQGSKPLVLISKREEGKKLLLIKWMQAHLKESRKVYKDVLVANFVTNTHNDLNSNHVLHRIMVKIKQVFNLKRGVDFRENNLRKNFNNWLHLVSDKIRAKTFFDGDLIIVIEGVNLFVEQNHGWENDLKFWLPRELPPRVKIILTIEEGSHNIAYLQKIGCKFLPLETDKATRLEFAKSFREGKFLASSEFGEELLNLVSKKVEEEKVTSGFIKSKPG